MQTISNSKNKNKYKTNQKQNIQMLISLPQILQGKFQCQKETK